VFVDHFNLRIPTADNTDNIVNAVLVSSEEQVSKQQVSYVDVTMIWRPVIFQTDFPLITASSNAWKLVNAAHPLSDGLF
jgi:hypothetical protein